MEGRLLRCPAPFGLGLLRKLPDLDFGQFSKWRTRGMPQNMGVRRIFGRSRARPGPCKNSRRHPKCLQNGRIHSIKIGQSPAKDTDAIWAGFRGSGTVAPRRAAMRSAAEHDAIGVTDG